MVQDIKPFISSSYNQGRRWYRAKNALSFASTLQNKAEEAKDDTAQKMPLYLQALKIKAEENTMQNKVIASASKNKAEKGTA